MDAYSWFIANLHQFLGHEKTAAFLGVPVGDMDACLLCQWEREPTLERKQAVYDAFARGEAKE